MLLVAVTPMAWLVRLGLWGVLGWSLYYSLVTHAWRSSPLAITAIELDNEGMVSVRFAGSEILAAGPDHQPLRASLADADDLAAGKPPLAAETGDRRGCGRAGTVQALAVA